MKNSRLFSANFFTENQVKCNAIVLLTKSDELTSKARKIKLSKIQDEIARLQRKGLWNLEMIEWSNEEPLVDQEENLFAATSKLPSFSVQET